MKSKLKKYLEKYNYKKHLKGYIFSSLFLIISFALFTRLKGYALLFIFLEIILFFPYLPLTEYMDKTRGR